MSASRTTVLAADIGGTNGRFALFDTSDGMSLLGRADLATADHPDFASLIRRALEELGSPKFRAAVLAVAGPVSRGRFCRPPNIAYLMDLDALPKGLLPELSLLINDFAAQAHGCRLFGESRSEPVLGGHLDASLTQAVIGPGTGLGKAALVPDGRGGFVVCGSEGGHAAFPFQGADERRFQDFLESETGEPYARWEGVVSGSGLALMHRFLTGERLSPAEIAAKIEPSSPTAEWFARFLGRACRDYVLEVLARGGLFISGGVAAKNPLFARHEAFVQEFRKSATHQDLLAGVCVRLVSELATGLWGAAACARSLTRAAAGEGMS